MPQQLRVLIVGGGIAGNALTFWLSRQEFCQITVVEHFPTLRTTGLQVDLRSHGVSVLRRMNLEEAFLAKAAPEPGMQFIDQSGRKRAYFAANKTGTGGQGLTSQYEIMRGDLTRLMYDNSDQGRVRWLFGTSIESFDDNGSEVKVQFSSGTTETFDLLIGADGVWSSTRRTMESAPGAYTSIGEFNAYLTIPRPIQKGETYDGLMYFATRKRAILVRRHNPDLIQLYLLLNRNEERLDAVQRGDVEGEKAAFKEIFKDAGWRAPELLEGMMASEDFYCERLGLVRMDRWYKGNVTFAGDAAWCPGGSGMGTSCALVGAYVLAGELTKHCGRPDSDAKSGVAAALKSYDETYRPFMTLVQKGLDNHATDWLFPSSPWTIAVFHWVTSLLAWLKIDLIAGLWSTESTEKWKLPEYKELSTSFIKTS